MRSLDDEEEDEIYIKFNEQIDPEEAKALEILDDNYYKDGKKMIRALSKLASSSSSSSSGSEQQTTTSNESLTDDVASSVLEPAKQIERPSILLQIPRRYYNFSYSINHTSL